jgi:hypothetical protein
MIVYDRRQFRQRIGRATKRAGEDNEQYGADAETESSCRWSETGFAALAHGREFNHFGAENSDLSISFLDQLERICIRILLQQSVEPIDYSIQIATGLFTSVINGALPLIES